MEREEEAIQCCITPRYVVGSPDVILHWPQINEYFFSTRAGKHMKVQCTACHLMQLLLRCTLC